MTNNLKEGNRNAALALRQSPVKDNFWDLVGRKYHIFT